jgi:hypothetical protein
VNIWDHKFRTFGFPNSYDAGVWATGVIRGKNAEGWLQLEDVKAQGYKIEPGFSGAPVWDDEKQGIVGMIVVADTDTQIKAAYGIPADVLIEMIQKSGGISQVENPYRGLEVFEARHAQYFFGRTRMIDALAKKVSKENFVAVVGPSGSGKSSLIRAGLLPRLKNDASYTDIVITPTKNPVDRLILALLDWQNIYSLAEKLAESKKISDLILQDPTAIERFFLQVSKNRSDQKLLLIVDQFEELFTQVANELIRQVFIHTLITISKEKFAIVVIAIRADFFGYILDDQNLGPLVNESQQNILPLSKDELREVIEEPALILGRKFEPGLVEIIWQESIGQPGYLPLLEFALTQLWEGQTGGGLMSLRAYDEIGRVAGAIARAAEQVFEKYERENKSSLVRQVFVRLVQPGLNAPDTRRRATKDELTDQSSGDIWGIVKDLADARLVVTSFDNSSYDETVEVSHEALIQGWSRLGGWIEEDREFLTWRQSQLDPEMQKWEASRRDPGELLKGASLVIAKRWLSERINDLSDDEKEFLFDSIFYAEDDYQETFPLFKPFDKTLSLIEQYLHSDDEDLRIKAVKALQWVDCAGDPEKEQIIFDKLYERVIGDDPLPIRNLAMLVLCRLGKLRSFAGQLATQLRTNVVGKIISALAYARNIPNFGRDVDPIIGDKSLQKFSRKIRRESIVQLVSKYRNELAIPLLFVFLLAQLISLVRSPLIYVLNNTVIRRVTSVITGDGTIIDYSLNLDVFRLVMFLALFQYLVIRKMVINGQLISIKDRVITALLAHIFILPVSFLTDSMSALPIWMDGANFLEGLNVAFRYGKYSPFYSAIFVIAQFFSEFVILMVLSLRLRFDVESKNLARFTFMLALLSSGAGAIYLLLLLLFDIGPQPYWIIERPSYWFSYLWRTLRESSLLVFPNWFFNFSMIWVCLLGFYFGLRIASFPTITQFWQPVKASTNFRHWRLALAVFALAFLVLSQYKSILAIRCTITGKGTAVTINDGVAFYTDEYNPGKYLSIGTCLAPLGKNEYSDKVYVKINSEVGWIFASTFAIDVSGANNVDNIPIMELPRFSGHMETCA